MGVKQQVAQQLQQWSTAGGGNFALDHATATGRLTATITAVDKLACAFESLQYASPALANKSLGELKDLSAKLCAKLCYLLEPIALIETDPDACATQLRSSPPLKEDDQTFYYEIFVRRGGTINFCRFQKQPGNVRQVVSATLTNEVFARLAQDLVEAVD